MDLILETPSHSCRQTTSTVGFLILQRDSGWRLQASTLVHWSFCARRFLVIYAECNRGEFWLKQKKRKYIFTAISNIYLTEHICISMTKSFQVINSQLDICWLSVREKHICTYKIVTCPASLSHPSNITKIGKHLKRVRNYLYKQKDLYIQVYPYRFLLDSKLFSTDSWTCWVEAAHSAAVQRPQSLTVSPLGGIRALLCFSVSWNHVLYLWYLKASLFILLLLYSAPIYLELTCYLQRTEVKS